MQRVIEICSKADKAVPAVLEGFSEAFNVSLGEKVTSILANQAEDSLYGVFKTLRSKANYQNDPDCVDYTQSLDASMRRMGREGVFGDCGAYAVAISALAARKGFGSGVWLLLGDEANPGQHIVNAFHIGQASGVNTFDLVIDGTMPDGYGWQIPEQFTVVRVIDPKTGREV